MNLNETTEVSKRNVMDLVLLVSVSVALALATGELARRAMLGSRMEHAFEAVKEGMQQMASPNDAPIQGDPSSSQAAMVKTVNVHHGPITGFEKSFAEYIPASTRHVPLQARRRI